MCGHVFSPRFCPEGPVVGRAFLLARVLRRAEIVKRPEEAMEILEAYDLTGSLRGAAALAGCDHKTVARLVAAREAAGGGLPGGLRGRRW
jgi:hypothetical protein